MAKISKDEDIIKLTDVRDEIYRQKTNQEMAEILVNYNEQEWRVIIDKLEKLGHYDAANAFKEKLQLTDNVIGLFENNISTDNEIEK